MIEPLNNIEVINSFLKNFNVSITDLSSPFKKYIGYNLDSKIVSFLNYSLIYDRIEIEYIYTDIAYRNKDIASKLIAYLLEVGLNNKCTNITLEVRASNINAINFYKKNGFKEIAIRKRYYESEDGILMIRELV